jgi:endonuclease YncB( thermonuclease family)
MAAILRFRRARLRGGSEWGGFRSMIWSGLLLGLLYTNISWWTAPGTDAFDLPLPQARDPWAESRRSRDNLREQEGAPQPAATSPGPVSGSYQSSLRVVDGDTFWLGGDKIRIADIDTPELEARCPSELALAQRATRRLEGLLDEGPFEMSPIAGRDEDRYGRKLRILTRNGRSLGDVLVAEGLARTWTGQRQPWC